MRVFFIVFILGVKFILVIKFLLSKLNKNSSDSYFTTTIPFSKKSCDSSNANSPIFLRFDPSSKVISEFLILETKSASILFDGYRCAGRCGLLCGGVGASCVRVY